VSALTKGSIEAGTPDIDPDKHRLVIHGPVKQSLVFTVDALSRYPMESRMAFVECGGNSAPMFSKEPPLNKIIGDNDVLDAQTLSKIKMPNRDNFIVRFPDRI
jgi:DMSO/TMAO reductase YedYZ molybdopterin-dependent catalytic subunit